MASKRWQVGICGTFDVENFGDLLFPLIAEYELRQRLGDVELHRFSYRAKAAPAWPFEVTSLTALPNVISRLDGLLIGGGFLVRFDKDVAPGYLPPDAAIHHPTGYWLTPALMALQHNVPLVWNAPGMHCNDIPSWARPLMQAALTLSRYVSVRDEPSRFALEPITGSPVVVVPDTAFRLPQLLQLNGAPSAEFTRLCGESGLSTPYIVVQATLGLERFLQFVKKSDHLRGYKQLALPIGPVLGDREDIIDADLPGLVRLNKWPDPLTIAELIARSEGVIGHSYHLFITALGFGVPAFTPQDLSIGKYSTLRSFERLYPLAPDEETIDWFLARLGRSAPSSVLGATQQQLSNHWDIIAGAIQSGPAQTAPALNRFWQGLPGLLEDAGIRESAAVEREQHAVAALLNERVEGEARLREAVACEQEAASARHLNELNALSIEREEMEEALSASRLETTEIRIWLNETRIQLNETRIQLDEALRQLHEARLEVGRHQGMLADLTAQMTVARADLAARDTWLAEIKNSRSWKLTAPVRALGRRASGKRTRLINAERIKHHRAETFPYRWAVINDLFQPDDSAELARTYPCDHFKRVSASGGEKDYEYEARCLIRMGSEAIAYPEHLSPAWRTLATDLLSREYREAMATLSGCDLAQALLEVNVFHYGPGGSLGPHRDLPEKLVTHVVYFNRSWNRWDGGCLQILRSADPTDLAAEIPPVAGYSSVLVRSESSWHAVSRVVSDSPASRRSVTVTFYRPGSVSSMWPPDDVTPLHNYEARDLEPARSES